VVLSPSSGSAAQTHLLGFLDLDMAFSRQTYVDVQRQQLGTSEAQFKALLFREHVNLMEVLTGVDSSNGVPQIARPVVSQQLPIHQALRWALYDTLILSYQRGYAQQAPLVPFSAALHRTAQTLMKLAIIVMADYVA
jgi:hypothetical protein